MRTAAVLLGVKFFGCGPMSTDEICQDACGAWSSCDNAGNSSLGRSYSACCSKCRKDGDWTWGYAQCVRSKYWCSDMENEC